MERRLDPREDVRFSLRNLLRHRCSELNFALAIVATPQGMIFAGSREDHLASQVAVLAAEELFRGETDLYDRFTWLNHRTGARISGLRFEVEGKTLFLAVLERATQRVSDTVLYALADRVGAILAESRVAAAAAAA